MAPKNGDVNRMTTQIEVRGNKKFEDINRNNVSKQRKSNDHENEVRGNKKFDDVNRNNVIEMT